MRFIYGKHDWKTFERGEENCYLMTNGLGGFSSLSLIGSCSRNDQAVFMACTHSPNHRYNMIHRLEEILAEDSYSKKQYDEIANAIIYLASDRANYITGQVISVNGGCLII